MMSKFQSTLPRRERLKFVHRVQNFPHFNPRSREGSDVHRIVDFIEVCLFQSTLPRRERLFAAPSSFPNLIFQSTLPRRERPSRAFNSRWQRTFQSTLPRRERHGIKTITDAFAEFQSTLPRRERLLPEHRLHRLLQISIHAPAKGATAEWMLWEIDHRNFNPRSREGSDRKAFYKSQKVKKFQSTLPRRERPKGRSKPGPKVTFQSTLPRRERRL